MTNRLRLAAWLPLILVLAGCTLARSRNFDDRQLLTPAALPTPSSDAVPPPLPPSAARGFDIYAAKCQACHGELGMGDGPRAALVRQQGSLVTNLVDPARARPAIPNDWLSIISRGRIERLMPGFANSLSVQDLWDVLAYVWAMGTTSPTLSAGQAAFASSCAACHGAKGEMPVGARNVRLNDPAFAGAASLARIHDGAARGDAHRSLNLSETQSWQVADAVRALNYAYTEPAILREQGRQGDGALTVNLVHLGGNAQPPRDAPVVLRAYDAQGEVFSRTIAADGSVARFDRLRRDASYFYQAETKHQGGRFFAAPAQFTNTQRLTATLGLYDVGTDASAISISEMHYFVQDVGEGMLSVVELYVFDNASDKAYMDAPALDGALRSLKLSAPPDAQNIRFDGPGFGARFSRDGDLIYDSDSVAPGPRAASITMLYELPYRNQRRIERRMAYPLKRWDVILPDADLRVTSTGMTDKGLQDTGSARVRLVTPVQAGLPAGGSVAFELTGQPRGATSPGGTPLAIGLGFVLVAVSVFLAYMVLQRARVLRAQTATADEGHNTREQLLREIAALDDAFAARQIKEKTYRRRREILLQRLRDVWDAA